MDNLFNSERNQLNIEKLIDELEIVFTKDNISARFEKVREILKYKTGRDLLFRLSERNLEDIIVYIINDYPRDELQEHITKTDLFKDVYFNCIKKNQLGILEALDKQGINYANFIDDNGNSGLLFAVIYSQIQIVKYLLKQKPNLMDIKNNSGYDPLTISVYNNDNLMFFLLVNNAQQIIDWSSLCKLAIRNENAEILSYLTRDINKIKSLYTPDHSLLHYAACQTDIGIFNTIVAIMKVYDYKIKPINENPLHWAVMRSNYNIVKALISLYKKEHIDIDQKTIYGITPFFLSNLRQDKYICELLFENGANANESDIEGNSIVHLISALGDTKWLKYMIKKFNVNVYTKNEKGDIPLVTAILNENKETVEYFLELFKAATSTSSSTPASLVSSLPKVSSNINWKNKYGQTPLHAAVFVGNVDIIEMLLKNKADITIMDVNELSPYHYAYIGKKEHVIKLIHSILGVDKNVFMK